VGDFSLPLLVHFSLPVTPGAAVLDPQAVHLLGGVVAAYPRHGVAERRQQVRQVRPTGNLQLLF